MNNYSFAIVTPSYAPDFARCQLLCETMDRHSILPVKHYLVVDRKDFKLFKTLQTANREIITVESVLPWWIKKVEFMKNGWISLKSLPLRNWIIQQIVKLSIAKYITEDVITFVDSDVAFVRPFDMRDFVKSDRVRLFRVPDAITAETKLLPKWHEVSNKLLNLPSVDYPCPNYLGNFITWKRENVLALHQYLEEIHGRSWVETIANSWHLSEYILYGTFVELVLQEKSQHYFDEKIICHNYWETSPMSRVEVSNFFVELPQDYFAVMISAKSHTELSDYVPYVLAENTENRTNVLSRV